MRFVPTNCLRPGMVLATPIYKDVSKSVITILGKDMELSDSYIEHIKELGHNGAYIKDELSQNNEITNVINYELKTKALKDIESLFLFAKNEEGNKDHLLDNIKQTVTEIIENILNNHNLLVNMIDLKIFDNYTYSHSVNVCVLSIMTGVSMKMDKDELYELGLSALLHDIGKVFIDPKILNKPNKLTPSEFEIMKNHSLLGFEYMTKNFKNLPNDAYIGSLQHHEKCDGTGYPYNLLKNDISQIAKIISIADVYDALTSDRPYRKSFIPSEGIEYINGGSQSFDISVVKHFNSIIALYPVDTIVKLSNGDIAVIIENRRHYNNRPIVKVINGVYKDQTLDLKTSNYLNITIKEVLRGC